MEHISLMVQVLLRPLKCLVGMEVLQQLIRMNRYFKREPMFMQISDGLQMEGLVGFLMAVQVLPGSL